MLAYPTRAELRQNVVGHAYTLVDAIVVVLLYLVMFYQKFLVNWVSLRWSPMQAPIVIFGASRAARPARFHLDQGNHPDHFSGIK